MPISPRKAKFDPKKFVRKIAVAGSSNSGKTRLGATFQDAVGPIYVLDLDGGSTTLQSRGDVDTESANTAIDAEKILWSFLNKEKETLGYSAIMIDGYSSLIRREFQEATVGKGREATWKDYGKSSTLGTRLIQLIKDLPITAIVNVWARESQAKIPGTDTVDPNAPIDVKPDVPGGAYNPFMGSVDDVWYLTYSAKDKARYLYTSEFAAGSKLIHAKMRDEAVAALFTSEFSGKALPIIKDPTWVDLFARYQRAYQK